jgi:hypothetical protein
VQGPSPFSSINFDPAITHKNQFDFFADFSHQQFNSENQQSNIFDFQISKIADPVVVPIQEVSESNIIESGLRTNIIFGTHTPEPTVQQSAPNVQHSAPNVQHSAPNVQHSAPVSAIQFSPLEEDLIGLSEGHKPQDNIQLIQFDDDPVPSHISM